MYTLYSIALPHMVLYSIKYHHYKLGKIFSIQKRCVRLLFGKEVSKDRPEFYFTCARIRTYNQHNMEHKSYCLEYTKPLFNEHKILNLETFIFTTCSWRFLRYQI